VLTMKQKENSTDFKYNNLEIMEQIKQIL